MQFDYNFKLIVLVIEEAERFNICAARRKSDVTESNL